MPVLGAAGEWVFLEQLSFDLRILSDSARTTLFPGIPTTHVRYRRIYIPLLKQTSSDYLFAATIGKHCRLS